MSRDADDRLDALGIPSRKEVEESLSPEALRNTDLIAQLIGTISLIHGYSMQDASTVVGIGPLAMDIFLLGLFVSTHPTMAGAMLEAAAEMDQRNQVPRMPVLQTLVDTVYEKWEKGE
jgi:hypothetical protein